MPAERRCEHPAPASGLLAEMVGLVVGTHKSGIEAAAAPASVAARQNLVAPLKAEGIPLTPEFVRLISDRRRELRAAWEKVLPNRVGRWAAAGWYDRMMPLARDRVC